MKRTTLASAMLSLVMTISTVGLGQSKAKARVKPPVKGGQICTGCCDPCYSDDGWEIRHPQPSTTNAKATKATRAKKGNR